MRDVGFAARFEYYRSKNFKKVAAAMIKRRRFRAHYIKSDEGTGIGIIEYRGDVRPKNWEEHVIAIHSIYIAENISHRDALVNIFQFIRNRLEDDEYAILQIQQKRRMRDYELAYQNRIKVFKTEVFRGRLFHAQLLAQDAIKRKTSISEHFDEPMVFSIIKQEQEERKGDINCKKT